MTTAPPPYHIPRNGSEPSLKAPTLPPYTEHAGTGEDIELASLSSSSTHTLPAAESSPSPSPSQSSSAASNSTFTPTKQLQIQTQGKNLLSFPTPTPADPIPIFTLTPTGHLDRPLYFSIRPQQRSGSCFLTHADDETRSPLTTTTYRFGYGPGRRPVMVLGDPARNPAPAPRQRQSLEESGKEEEGGKRERGGEREVRDEHAETEREGQQTFEIAGRSLFSRAIRFHVPGLGTFGWRYADSAERAAVEADSLLVCEVFYNHNHNHNHFAEDKHDNKVKGKRQDKGKEKDNKAHRIAHLVRNATYRTPGTSRSSAGNGGRLMLDLSVFEEKSRERVEWLVVTTAVAMLKREVDRRRSQQIAALAAVAS
ncbi:hypothetical protein F5Y07DRAFT_270098 [Xylaria sp. FL0933]|nr:hypothetical protein F5Y07DRAFT_270098 [Xylaria sp. FL0933]